jgi:hypothetical protein
MKDETGTIRICRTSIPLMSAIIATCLVFFEGLNNAGIRLHYCPCCRLKCLIYGVWCVDACISSGLHASMLVVDLVGQKTDKLETDN